MRDLRRFATVVRYNERGHGLSDWEIEDHSLEARVGDLEAVADHAGLDRFALMAMSRGGPPAIEYAVRHPERLTRLLFYASSAALLHDPRRRSKNCSTCSTRWCGSATAARTRCSVACSPL